MKAGELRVDIQQEDVLWYDRKRVTIFALPWSFTKYKLTQTKLIVETGVFNRREEEVNLYRVSDMAFTQSLFERMTNTGTIKIMSNDTSCPEVILKHIKDARKIKEVISQTVESARVKSGVKTAEMVGGAHHPGDGCQDHNEEQSM